MTFAMILACTAVLSLAASVRSAHASQPTCVNKTTANGLGSNSVYGVYAVGNTIYAATTNGLSISTDSGTSFTNVTISAGLGDNVVYGVHADGNSIYAATIGGLSVSTNSGTSFTNVTTSAGLGSNFLFGVYAVGNSIYAATAVGLSVSTNSAASFTNVTTANGLGGNFVWGVYAVGNTIYAATDVGLSISTNGGTSFTNVTTSAGLGNNSVRGVYAVGNTIYAATIGGLSISTNSGTSFTNVTTSAGLAVGIVLGVYASGNTIYAASSGGLSISTNGGTSFTSVTSSAGLGNDTVYGVSAIGNTIYAATAGGLSICTFPTTSSPATPLTPIWRATLDPNGGTCTDGTGRTEPWTTAFVGYRYLPGASDCTKPGHTFAGWTNTTTPAIPVDLPVLTDPSDGQQRSFIATNANLTAIWTKNPEPKAPTTFVALNGFFCRNCGNWLIWNKADNATQVTVTSGTRTVCTTLKITINEWTLCHDPQPPRGPNTYTLTATNETTSSPPITATTPR
jgi:uncharacterized repeat protein (TIGR02543 family)